MAKTSMPARRQRRRSITQTIGTGLESIQLTGDIINVKLRVALALEIKDSKSELIDEGYTSAEADAILVS